jgi:hypothetical protein
MAVPSSLEPAATLEKKDLRQKLIVDDQVPPAPTSAAASHEAAVAATELASTSKDGLVDLSLSRCFLMDKEKEVMIRTKCVVHYTCLLVCNLLAFCLCCF